jgi:hypothetical protein
MLVELQGGSIDLKSVIGEGTTVTLNLPAHRLARQGHEHGSIPAVPPAAAQA